MKRVSRRIVRFTAVAALIAVVVVQPVLAVAKTPESSGSLGFLIRKIIRVLDTIDIRLPPG
jgi:hypothetical protein